MVKTEVINKKETLDIEVLKELIDEIYKLKNLYEKVKVGFPENDKADLAIFVKLKKGIHWGDFVRKISKIKWEIFEKTEYLPFVEIYFEKDKK
jgi:hypothetical protein